MQLQYNCNIEDFIIISNQYGFKATTTRKQIFLLLKKHSPVLASEFLEIAKKNDFDIVTVYRTITLFQKYGVIFEFGSGKQRTLQFNTPDSHDHHHYIRCKTCDKVSRFEDADIENKLFEISKRNGFYKVESHYLEIIGICKNCARTIN